MNVSAPDPRLWTPESRAAYCKESGLSEADLDIYKAMHAAWEAFNFTDYGKQSAERTKRRLEAHATWRQLDTLRPADRETPSLRWARGRTAIVFHLPEMFSNNGNRVWGSGATLHYAEPRHRPHRWRKAGQPSRRLIVVVRTETAPRCDL